MDNGIYTDLSNEDYHAAEGISSSAIKTVINKSVLHTKVKFSSSAMDLGTATHTAILEPHKLDSEVVVMPEINRRTKTGKEEYAEFMAANEGKLRLTQDEMDKVLAMRDSVFANAEWNNLLHSFDAQVEHSAFAEIDGHKVKCRPDWYSASNSLIVDLKTTKNAHPQSFFWDAKKYGYKYQTPWYSHIWQDAGGGDVDQFLFLAVESSYPFDFTIHEVNPADLQSLWGDCLDALDKIIVAKRDNDYTGYSKEVNYL